MPTDTLALADKAKAAGSRLPEAHANLKEWLDAGFLPGWAVAALGELAAQGAWSEMNDRFFRKLAFGTGGMRGRTQGGVVAPSELGKVGPLGTPEHAAVGSNNMNDFNLVRATVGLFRYTARSLAGEPGVKPVIVIAHDVRHFSRHFAELIGSIWTGLGGRALLFEGPRSTPQLSFTVRHEKAHAGVVITASHNPAHDNGFKCYWNDGAQVVPPHDTGIIDAVNAVSLAEVLGVSRQGTHARRDRLRRDGKSLPGTPHGERARPKRLRRRAEGRLHEHPRYRRRDDPSGAREARARCGHRRRAAPARPAFPDREIAQSGERRRASARRRAGEGLRRRPRSRDRSG